MGKLIVELPDELHARLKAQALTDHKTLKVIVTTLLQHHLKSPRIASPKKATGTGLCGAWKDPHSAEELIAAFRASRRWRLGAPS